MEKTWLALVKDTSWTMALVETSEAGVVLKALNVFEFSFGGFGSGDEGKGDEGKGDEGFDSVKVKTIKDWMERYATGPSRIKIVLDSSAVLTRLVELPRVSSKTLERHFQDNVSGYFESAVNMGFLDNHVINFKITEYFERDGHNRVRILLAALPKSLLKGIYRLTNDLGIDLASINIACECFIRVFEEMLPESADNAFIDLDVASGHICLMQNGTIVQYAKVQVDLERLMAGLKRWEWPESGKPLRSLDNQPPGFGAAHGTDFFHTAGKTDTAGLFPEFSVISPKMAEPELDDLFVKAKDLPFSLQISDRDLMSERNTLEVLATQEWPADDRTDVLYSDEGIREALQRVFAQLRELISDYTQSLDLEMDAHPFSRLYVTGLGAKTNKFTFLLKEEWKGLVPVSVGFLEDWLPPLAQSEEFVADWTKQVCLLGLILKTYDELR